MKELLTKIKNCSTMPQLDEMRLELVTAGRGNVEVFKTLQSEFIKKKNQLERIPRMERTW